MEMQNKSLVIGRNSLVTEMLALLAGAMVAGLAAATIAGLTGCCAVRYGKVKKCRAFRAGGWGDARTGYATWRQRRSPVFWPKAPGLH
jgi:hypothetical protein